MFDCYHPIMGEATRVYVNTVDIETVLQIHSSQLLYSRLMDTVDHHPAV